MWTQHTGRGEKKSLDLPSPLAHYSLTSGYLAPPGPGGPSKQHTQSNSTTFLLHAAKLHQRHSSALGAALIPACPAPDTAGRSLLWWPTRRSAPPPSSSAENKQHTAADQNLLTSKRLMCTQDAGRETNTGAGGTVTPPRRVDEGLNLNALISRWHQSYSNRSCDINTEVRNMSPSANISDVKSLLLCLMTVQISVNGSDELDETLQDMTELHK